MKKKKGGKDYKFFSLKTVNLQSLQMKSWPTALAVKKFIRLAVLLKISENWKKKQLLKELTHLKKTVDLTEHFYLTKMLLWRFSIKKGYIVRVAQTKN